MDKQIQIIKSSEGNKYFERNKIYEYDFDFKKTSVVYQSAPNLNKNFEINDKKDNILLFVGSRLKYKNFEKLLEAFSLKKEILYDFKLVCFGSEKVSDKEKFLIKK